MEVDVAPDAEPAERRAIAEALGLERSQPEPEAYASPWWRAGLVAAERLAAAESLGPAQATARRRKSAGALRA